MYTMLLSPEFETEKVLSPDFRSGLSPFERFLADGKVYNPDCYLVNENEDFSFEGIDVFIPEPYGDEKLVA
jgi:hypothetical protein